MTDRPPRRRGGAGWLGLLVLLGPALLTTGCFGFRFSIEKTRTQISLPPPGASAPHPVVLPPQGAIPDDLCYVPGGWFRFGAHDVTHQAWPASRRWVDDFLIQRLPVTNRAYMAFLDDLVASGREAEATRFAVESDWAAEYDETPPLGFHAAYRWLTSEQMLKLLGAVEYAVVDAA